MEFVCANRNERGELIFTCYEDGGVLIPIDDLSGVNLFVRPRGGNSTPGESFVGHLVTDPLKISRMIRQAEENSRMYYKIAEEALKAL